MAEMGESGCRQPPAAKQEIDCPNRDCGFKEKKQFFPVGHSWSYFLFGHSYCEDRRRRLRILCRSLPRSPGSTGLTEPDFLEGSADAAHPGLLLPGFTFENRQVVVDGEIPDGKKMRTLDFAFPDEKMPFEDGPVILLGSDVGPSFQFPE